MRIAINMDGTHYYTAKMYRLAVEFQKMGHDTYVGFIVPSASQIYQFCVGWKPDVVIDLNRSRGQAEGFPRDIKHIFWGQDFEFDRINIERDSDINYFVINPYDLGYKYKDHNNKVLHAGVDPDIFKPTGRPINVDFNFCGYLPKPIPEELLKKSIYSLFVGEPIVGVASMGRDVLLGEVFNSFINNIKQSSADYGNMKQNISNIFSEVMEKAGGHHIRVHNKIVGMMEYSLYRMVERKEMIDLALSVSKSLRIYGPTEWHRWEIYKDNYKGHLVPLDMIANAHSTAKINLHSGNWTWGHWRVMESMACARPIMIQQTPRDDKPGEILDNFEPYTHYIPWNQGNFVDNAKKYLKDDEACKKMGEEARKVILAKHTWRHRAEQILKDLKEL